MKYNKLKDLVKKQALKLLSKLFNEYFTLTILGLFLTGLYFFIYLINKGYIKL